MRTSTDKRQRLIEAGLQEFADKGLEHTKVSNIVKRAGVAQGTFYLYFQSKTSLIPAIADDMLQKLLTEQRRRVEPLSTLAEQLEELVDVTFQVTNEYKDVLALCYSGLAIEGEMNQWETIYEPYYHWMTELLKKAREDGELNPNVKEEVRAKMVISLMEESAERLYLFSNQDEEASEVRAELLHMLRASLLHEM
ncbi:TetR family transcriptional regulator [Salsuginibacillus kocurii]|uniref:TetR family transcriptional regulator n=1 Tax=Salsuginibacillus kocurii TaxID=427078 RepID=UPI00037C4DAF|nr:TetR family transcriptional regulator [Salsuginibacillus kocurii]